MALDARQFTVDKYFIKKYKASGDISVVRPLVTLISNDKMTIKDVLEYIRVNYNFIPPSQ